MNRMLSVDMLGEARNAQWDPDTFFGPGTVKAVAPAKVNLFLDVHPKTSPEETMHAVDTVMHTLALHDILYIRIAPLSEDELASYSERIAGGEAGADSLALVGPADNAVVSIDLADKTSGILPNDRPLDFPAAQNLVSRAVDVLMRAVNHEEPTLVNVRIEKAIPAQAGLGGGSSDAAAMLIALADALGVDRADDRITDAARSLGADVAFFIGGGCRRLEGVGDVEAAVLEPMHGNVVLVKPDGGVPTAAAYDAFDASPAPVSEAVALQAREAGKASEVPLCNNLADAALTVCPELAKVREWLADQPGVIDALLCGSGAATFAIMDDVGSAMALSAQAMKRGWWARATSFANLKAVAMPSRRP